MEATVKNRDKTQFEALRDHLLAYPEEHEYVEEFILKNDFGGSTVVCGEHPVGKEFKSSYVHFHHFDKKGRRQKVFTIALVDGRPVGERTTRRHWLLRLTDILFPL